eukprot:Gb_24381 [translate_table: standard]
MGNPNGVVGDDGSMWSELPEHLVERLAAFLPVECLHRFRSVCRHWSELFGSKYFINLRIEVRSGEPAWLVLCTPNTDIPCHVYSFRENAWHTLSLSFLPDCKYGVNCKGSAGGLLLVGIPGPSCFATTLCICNPLTKSWRSLPRMTSIAITIANGIVENGNHNYAVVAVGKSRGNLSVVEVYESLTESWRIAGNLPDGLVIKNNEIVICDGFFFCLTVKPSGIMAYNIQQGAWKMLGMPLEDASSMFIRLLRCGSWVIMVGGIKSEHVLRDVMMWKLEGIPKEWRWKKIQGMAEGGLIEDFRKTLCSNWFECVGVGEYVCFRGHGSLEVVAYNVVKRTWEWIPKWADCKYENTKYLLLTSLAYQPRTLQVS